MNHFPKVKKPIIALLHLNSLPGDPFYNGWSMKEIVAQAAKDLDALQKGGVDAVLFTNEFSIPYQNNVDHIATAAIARTSVAVKSGQQTRLTSVFHSVFLLMSMFLLGGVMAKLPLSALAGVLMVTAWRMNEWEGIRYLFKHKFKSGISQFLITMVTTVVADLTVAILVGIVYSAILYISKASHIRVSFSKVDTSRLEGLEKAPILENAGVAYITGDLFFGAVDEFNHQMEEMPPFDYIIFSLRGMPRVDVSGVQTLMEMLELLIKDGRAVVFCGVTPEVRTYFDRAGITQLVHGERGYYWSADQAIMDLLNLEKAAR